MSSNDSIRTVQGVQETFKGKDFEVVTIDRTEEATSAASTPTQQQQLDVQSENHSMLARIQQTMAPAMIYVVSIAQFIDISKFHKIL